MSALMDTDLNVVIRSKQRLTEEHNAYFIYQILRGLKYIHAACILHRCVCGGGGGPASSVGRIRASTPLLKPWGR